MIKEQLTGTMIVRCFKCGKITGTVPCRPDLDGETTSDVCDPCNVKWQAEIAALNANKPKKSGDPCYNRWQEEGGGSAGFTWADEGTYIERDRRRAIEWVLY